MQCIHLKIRTKKYEKYIYCKQRKKKIEFKECNNCKYREFKKAKELKKKSNKLKSLESKRYSIITDNLKVCYICKQKKKDDLHEIFGGSNRIKSMVWGLVIPICRGCHQEWKINKNMREEYQQEAQRIFEKEHGYELFMTEFKKNFL
ncbi:MAG: hypothetical protein HFJ47_01650 [Clostridia bacterium]|nr:hypothetical protein [Clostridia bacterium]